ncbi:MAG: hypothetical protein JXR37_33620 [Kiritimatiellae bacterium]|nr:hypothetical protein [Kiritimatiellia bacterium]
MKKTDIHPHRGGSASHPEDTLVAFERNLRDGFSLDMDLRKTADGEIVVIHDRTTGRTCDKDWVVAHRTAAELKTLDAAYHFDPGKDGRFPLRGKGIGLSTLDEVFALFSKGRQPDASMWIDTKDDQDCPIAENAVLYDRLIDLIGRFDLWEAAHIEVSRAEEADALRSRDERVTAVFWGKDLGALEQALAYPHYVRMGMPPPAAMQLADRVRGAGKRLHVTRFRYEQAVWDELKAVRPDSVGVDDYQAFLALTP